MGRGPVFGRQPGYHGGILGHVGTKDHFLPAALIGGFGHAAAGRPARQARVLWRRREWTQPRPTKAAAIGFVRGMYRLAAPPSGTSADRVDELWGHLESPLPPAIARASLRRETSADHTVLLDYVAAAGVRHPDFAASVNRWRGELGMALVTGDDLQIERVALLARGLELVQRFRWRFVHAPADGPRLVLNDRGWTYIGEQDRPGRGLFVPLNGRLALLAWMEPGMVGVFDHLVLKPSWAKWLNCATWEDSPTFVVGHPEDGVLLERLRTTAEVAPELGRWGAYRGRRHQLFGHGHSD